MHPPPYACPLAGCRTRVRFLARTLLQSVTPTWHARKKEIVTLGLAAPGIDKPFQLHERYLQNMEDALQGRMWLAGNAFSLAYIGMTPYVNRLDMLGMSKL